MKQLNRRVRALFENKSFLLRFLVSSFFILLIPIATIFFTYFTAESAVRDEVLRNNRAVLTRLFDVFDERIAGLSRLAIQAGNNTLVTSAIVGDGQSKPPDLYNRYQMRQYLSTLLENGLSDVFVYFRNTDTVLSGMGASGDSRSYYDYYYSTDRMTFEQWRILFNLQVNQDLRVVYTKEGARTLAYVQSLPIGSIQNCKAVICFVLNPSLANSLLFGAGTAGSGAILIFDADGKLLVCSDDRFAEADPRVFKGAESLHYSMLSGENCAVLRFASHSLPCTYLSVVPISVLWARISALRLICILSVALCMAVSVALAVMLARRNYHPVFHMIGEVSRQTQLPYNRSEENEAEFVSHAFERIVSEKNSLSRMLESESGQLREDFLFQAVQGIASGDGDWRAALASHGIPVISDLFCVLLIRLENWDPQITGDVGTPESRKATAMLMQDVLSGIFGGRHLCYVLRLDKRRFAAVANLREDADDGELRAMCEKARETFALNLSLSCSICAGPCVRGLSGIHSSYLGSLAVLDYLFAFGVCRTVLYEQIKTRRFAYNASFRGKAEQEILHFLQAEAQTSDAAALVEEMARDAIDEGHSSLEAIKCFQYDATSLLNRIVSTAGIRIAAQIGSLVEPLVSADTFSDFKAGFASALRTLKVHSADLDSSDDPATHIRTHIDEHFADPQLNVNALGESVGLSPSYASKLFRNRYGVSPLEYLGRARITHAKTLLISTRKSIEDISARSGFLSSSAFIRTFKREEGHTPGNYRSLCEKK